MSLKQKVISGVKWTTLAAIIIGVLQLSQLFILARLLSPSEFGIIAIIMVIVGFSQIFMDMGISNGIIHKQDVTHKQLSTLYWLNILSGISLFILLNLLANPIANFYKMESLNEYIYLLSFAYLIIPFGQQFMILFQKEMKFDIIAKIDIFSYIIGFITTVSLAYTDYGIISFVYGILLFFIIRTVLFVINGIKEHKPSFYFKHKEAIFFLKFGMYQMGEKFINYFNTEIDVLIIGKILGPHSLGLYSIIKQLILKPIMLINPIITKVSFPLMAKYQNKNRIIRKIYMNIINSVSSIMFPIYLTMFFMSNEIILLFLGEKWIDSNMILKILALYAILRTIGNPVGALLMAKGRVDIGFYWNLALLFIFPLFIYIGSLYNLIGVTISLLLLGILLFIPNWYFQVYNVCKIKFKFYFTNIFNIFLINMISVTISYFSVIYLKIHSLIILFIFLIIYFLIYLKLIKKYNIYFYKSLKDFL